MGRSERAGSALVRARSARRGVQAPSGIDCRRKPALLAVARVDKLKRAEAGQRPVHEKHLDREIGLDVGLAKEREHLAAVELQDHLPVADLHHPLEVQMDGVALSATVAAAYAPALGSGKLGTPWARMHRANVSARSALAAVVLGLPKIRRRRAGARRRSRRARSADSGSHARVAHAYPFYSARHNRPITRLCPPTMPVRTARRVKARRSSGWRAEPRMECRIDR